MERNGGVCVDFCVVIWMCSYWYGVDVYFVGIGRVYYAMYFREMGNKVNDGILICVDE